MTSLVLFKKFVFFQKMQYNSSEVCDRYQRAYQASANIEEEELCKNS